MSNKQNEVYEETKKEALEERGKRKAKGLALKKKLKHTESGYATYLGKNKK